MQMWINYEPLLWVMEDDPYL